MTPHDVSVALALATTRPPGNAPLVYRRAWRDTVDQIAYQRSIDPIPFDRATFLNACGVDRALIEEPPLSRCAECGSTEIQTAAWIIDNTGETVDDEPPCDDVWCPECDDRVEIEYLDPPGTGTGMLALNVPTGQGL